MVKILVVEDSPTTRRLVKSSLVSLGYHDIVEAEDGVVALGILKAEDIDLVVTDWNMPNMNGIELTTVIRNDEKLQDVPVVLITTKGETEDIKKAIKSKINGYVVKPFTPEVLNRVITPIIEKIIKEKSHKEQNIVTIEIIIQGNTAKPIDELHISKAVNTLTPGSSMEFSSTIYEKVPDNLSLNTLIGIANRKLHVEVSLTDNESNTTEIVSL